MFDIVGFWVAVSLVCGVLLAFPFWGIVYLLDIWINNITNGDVCWVLRKKIAQHYDIFKDQGVNVVCIIVSAGLDFVYLTITTTEKLDRVQTISNIATTLAPVTTWLGILLLGGVIINWLAKKAYNLHKVVKKLDSGVK